MEKTKATQSVDKLSELCDSIRKLSAKGDYKTCEDMIFQAMKEYPHAPHPHNLLGIVLEKMGEHALAMKHFRAAWSLDPTYMPANQNLETYGTFFAHGTCAFDESDTVIEQGKKYTIAYDDNGVGYVTRKSSKK